MNQRYDEIELPENSSGYAHKGTFRITNFEVGVGLVTVKVRTSGHPEKEHDLKVGHSVIYNAGKKGKFEVHLVTIKEGDLLGNISASALFKITRL